MHRSSKLRARARGGHARPYITCRVWPERDEVLRMCVERALEIPQTQRLLRKSRNRALNPKLLRDAAILFSLSKRLNLRQAQALLRKLNAAPL
jgi:hypothetical protein